MTGPGPPAVPRWLVAAAAVSWRVLVVAAAVLATGILLSELRVAFLAIFVAIFATALLRPLVERLRSRGWPPAAAAGGVLVAAVAAVGGLLWLLLPPFIDQLSELGTEVRDGGDDLRDWLVDGPFDLSDEQIDDYIDDVADTARDNTGRIVSGVISGAQLVLEGLAVLLISLVLTFFFLKDGDRISRWLIGLFAPERRPHVAEIGSRSWATLAGYLRGVTIVATFDAVFIGLTLVLLGVPAALPLAVFTFFGAYVPIAGAVVAGLVAVLVALIGNGLITALAVLAAVIAVQQLESNLLQPVVVGRAVEIHPIAVLLAVTCGALIAGVLGALVAVPIAAVAARVGGYLREQSGEAGG
jgi:predicted PurR-regulated permease PerM